MPSAPPQGLLSGVRVIDLSRILAGPFASQTLADLGAEVIKVESPQGDDTRRWGPPFVGTGSERVAAYFLACNRGKHSLICDFADPAELAQLKALIASADVVLENFKVGALQKFGLDYDALSAGNPALIYCSITGFGQTGPDANQAGYDAMIQARGGLMSITGEAGGAPLKVGVAVADLMSGMYAATAICAALYRKAKSGKGECIDLALLDCQAAMLANQGMNFLTSGEVPARLGSAHPNIVPYQVMPASDGEFMLAVGNDEQFRRCCAIFAAPELGDDERFASNAQRVQQRAILIPRLTEKTRQQTRQHWLKKLAAAGVPAGPVQNIGEVMQDPQLLARGMIKEVAFGADQKYRQIGNPIHLKHHAVFDDRPSPRLGDM